jgi:O-antigen/teichoic acid export membrane protein
MPPVTEPRRHLGVGAALSVVVQGGPLLAGAVLSIVLARTIGPSANGRFALLGTLVGFLELVFSLSLSAGIVYEVSRRRWSVRQAFRTSYTAALVLGLAALAVGLGVFALLHDSVFAGISTTLAVVALISLPLVLAYLYADAILLAREHYEGYAGVEISHSATFLAIGAGLAIPFGVTGAVVGLPAAALVAASVGAVLLAREAARDTTAETPGSLGRALRFGLQNWGANLLQQINYRFDILILGAFAATSDVGVYSIALTLAGTAWVLPQGLQTVLFPRVAGLDEETHLGEMSIEESDAGLAKATRHGVLLTIPAGLLISVLLLVGVPVLYGPKFHQTIWLGFILLPGTLMLGVAKILSSGIVGRGYPRYTLYTGAITVPITLALYFGLIPPLDAWGAAIASSVSYALTSLVVLFYFRRATAVGLGEAFVPRAEDVVDYLDLVRHVRHRAGTG